MGLKTWAAGDQVLAADINGNFAMTHKLGGTGADGALTISSGTTTLDCANAAYFEKNYTSISITGTGKLAFSNPHSGGTVIVIKSQGDVTLTATAPCIDASGMGAAGGAGNASPGGCATANGGNGSNGTNANSILAGDNARGQGGGTGGSQYTMTGFYLSSSDQLFRRSIFITCGSGGGGGGSGQGSGVGGAGGRGGGALIIECGGAWNFTVTNGISVAGKDGVAGSASGCAAGYNGGGGGGGGSGGWCLVFYNTLTSNTGTINVSGGNGGGGAGGTGCGTQGGTGGGGAGMYGGVGGNHSAGANCGGYSGGAGYAGLSIVSKHKEL